MMLQRHCRVSNRSDIHLIIGKRWSEPCRSIIGYQVRVRSGERQQKTVQVVQAEFGPHPNLLDRESDLYTGDGELLAFSAFERWSLDDLVTKALCWVRRPNVTNRNSFLFADWKDCDVLHISAQGEAFAGVPDATNIRISIGSGLQSARLHYNDIPRNDMLSVCMSKYGV